MTITTKEFVITLVVYSFFLTFGFFLLRNDEQSHISAAPTHSMVMPVGDASSKQEREHFYQLRFDYQEKTNAKLMADDSTKARYNNYQWAWYLFEPTYSCELMTRIGGHADGAKWVCNPHVLKKQTSCLVYSLGVDGEVRFDEELQVEIPVCNGSTIYGFDPTPAVVNGNMPKHFESMGMHFYPWGIGNSDGVMSMQGKNDLVKKTLWTIMKDLGHTGRTIDILKIDVEGSEWSVFEGLFTDCSKAPKIHQILVEFHGPNGPALMKTFGNLQKCGFRIFMKEANMLCGNLCMEYALVHEDFLAAS